MVDCKPERREDFVRVRDLCKSKSAVIFQSSWGIRLVNLVADGLFKLHVVSRSNQALMENPPSGFS